MGNSVSETVMDDYARGIATFNSCDKAGSIPFFTRHLEAHPDHYNARMWRARAYGIVGDKANCLADLQIAKEKSSGVHQLMAELEIAEVQNKADEFLSILQNVINEYPHHAAGWSRFARFVHKYLEMDDDKALNLFLKAVEVAEANNQTDIPEYPWLNNYLGDVYHKNGNLELAEQYYKAAIRAASTLTIAHCGLSRVYLQKNNLEEARKCYDTARQLNPKLVHWEKFEAFRLAGVRNQTASDGNRKFTDSKKKGKKGQSGGGSDGSDGSDSDDQNTGKFISILFYRINPKFSDI